MRLFFLGLILTNLAWAETAYLVKFKSDIRNEIYSKVLESRRGVEHQEIPELNMLKVDGMEKEEIENLFGKDQLAYIEVDQEVRAFEAVNDPQFNLQAGLRRMQIPAAWDRLTTGREVIVAISDSGIDILHEDLVNSLWSNMREIPGNGRDDDGNGFVDDIHGWNFVTNSPNVDTVDSHGSHVAGIVGAGVDNGKGIAGSSPYVKLMSVQFLGQDGRGRISDGIKTLVYAADNGAKIINASWGADNPSRALEEALEYANSKGALVIAAAGNEQNDTDEIPAYPAAAPVEGVLSVASSAANGRLSNFSNYGQVSVDLVAAGSNILSTIPGNRYQRMSGTSMATPFVSGVAALILSQRPDLSLGQLKNAVLNAVDTYPVYRDSISTGGELNADKAIAQLSEGFQIWPARVSLKGRDSFQFTAFETGSGVRWSVSNLDFASIDSTGRVSAKKSDENAVVMITATNQAGETRSAEVFIKAEVNSDPGGGGGCDKAQASTGANGGSRSMPIGLLLIISYPFIRRIKKVLS